MQPQPSWYPNKKEDLNKAIKSYTSQKSKIQTTKLHGLIVPHAGYEYSGEIAGKAYSLIKNKGFKKAVILGPSHYEGFYGTATLNKLQTPLGEAKIKNSANNMKPLIYEHSIENQVPFLQFLGIKEITPVVVGNLFNDDAEKIAERLTKQITKDTLIVISTDLSHFLPYTQAVQKDKNTIKLIETLNLESFESLDACGKFPLLILFHLCKLKKNNWKPKLVEYKNSGDITGDKRSVVGYGSFWF
jgi:AmmeMemoRadiSam system protein B